MTLPPKALSALVDLKKELLSKIDPPESVIITPKSSTSTRKKGGTSTTFMRHAKKSNGFQRSCQRHDWSSPVY